jgi:hypothetical protein
VPDFPCNSAAAPLQLPLLFRCSVIRESAFNKLISRGFLIAGERHLMLKFGFFPAEQGNAI